MKHIERLRASLNAEFVELEALQRTVSDIPAAFTIVEQEDEIAAFNDLDEDISAFDAAASDNQADRVSAPDMMPAEFRTLAIPSTFDMSYPHLCTMELTLRVRQALRHLNALRGAIADKSFQYSHGIRVAPRKSVRTRARSAISKLNNIISFHCRAYSKCHCAMLRLHADEGTLSRFPVLSKEDVKCSTALLNPNTPGSSNLRLSWIWKTGVAADQATPHALQECMCPTSSSRR